MGEDHEKPSVNVDVGLSAKAEIKGEIPASSMGRFVDALTDAIRPFTESRGLRADQIRLQREDVLIKIALKARRRLELSGIEPRDIPNKTLVPLLEKASLEDPLDEDMLDRWAALLAAESGFPGPNRRWIIDILASLSGWQARLLNNIASAEPKREFFRIERYSRDLSSSEFGATLDLCTGKNVGEIQKLLRRLPGYTLFFDGADIANTNEFELADMPEAAELLHLDTLGLVLVNAGSFTGSEDRNFVLNAQLTPLGFHFTELFIEEDDQI